MIFSMFRSAAAIDPALITEAAQTDAELRKVLAAELTDIDCPDLVLPMPQRRNLAARTVIPFLDSLTPRADHLSR